MAHDACHHLDFDCRPGAAAFLRALPLRAECVSEALATLHACDAHNGTLLIGGASAWRDTAGRKSNETHPVWPGATSVEECALAMLGYRRISSAPSGVVAFARDRYHFPAGTAMAPLKLHGGVACTADGEFSVGANATWPASHHFLDRGIANHLLAVVRNGTLLDIGAGSGQYGAHFYSASQDSRQLHKLGTPRYTGIDGVRNVEAFTRAHGPPGSLVRYANVCARRLDLGLHDWVMSLEVGEHLPDSCLADYVRLLDASNRRGIIIAWSTHVNGQCHTNPRSWRHVYCLFHAMGYVLDISASRKGRHNAKLSWLKRDFTVLRRTSAVP